MLVYQHKDIAEIEKMLNGDFENLYDWLVDNKLSTHFGDDKTKQLLKNHTHVKKLGHTSEFLFSIY